MHRHLWVNDPDCLMLRSEDTALETEAAETWSRCVALSGGLAMVSDDLDLLGPDAQKQLEGVVAIGKESDQEARRGRPPMSPDLLAQVVPTTLTTARRELVTDPDAATSQLRDR
jgi:alpha-galactosidase